MKKIGGKGRHLDTTRRRAGSSGLPKIAKNPVSIRKDLLHELDLMRPLVLVRLVDAESIDPVASLRQKCAGTVPVRPLHWRSPHISCRSEELIQKSFGIAMRKKSAVEFGPFATDA